MLPSSKVTNYADFVWRICNSNNGFVPLVYPSARRNLIRLYPLTHIQSVDLIQRGNGMHQSIPNFKSLSGRTVSTLVHLGWPLRSGEALKMVANAYAGAISNVNRLMERGVMCVSVSTSLVLTVVNSVEVS